MAQLKTVLRGALALTTPAALFLLLVNMYFYRNRGVSDAVTILFGLTALLALAASDLSDRFKLGLGLWLAAGCALAGIALAIDPEVSVAETGRALQSFALIAGFVLFAGAALLQFGAERLLQAIFIAAAVSAAASIAVHFGAGHPLAERISLLGRAGNPIPAAAAMAVAALGGVALLRDHDLSPGLFRLWIIGLGIIILAMLLTQSRGPFIGLVLGCALMLTGDRWIRRAWIVVVAAFIGASSLILIEAPLRRLVCTTNEVFCRPSHRLELWKTSLTLIEGQPLGGMGIGHRLGEGAFNNPQNAALAIAVYFGIPFLLAACVGAALALRRLSTLEVTIPVRWAAAMMVFSAVYFALEPNPFAFFNAHYLFLWLPLALICITPRRTSEEGARQTPTPGL